MTNTPAIQAIETIYNSNRFRSRLEARWAAFMDCLGVKYQYEPEGFTDGATRYLVDFYLPRLDCYVEVKPTHEAFDAEARRKAKMLATGTGKAVFVFCGECAPPYDASHQKRQNDNCAYPLNFSGVVEWAREEYEYKAICAFGCCQLCQQVGIEPISWGFCRCNEVSLLSPHFTPQIISAFAIARSIRFERPYAARLTADELRTAWIHVWTEGCCRAFEDRQFGSAFASEAIQWARECEEPIE